jgi:hypothetical protein
LGLRVQVPVIRALGKVPESRENERNHSRESEGEREEGRKGGRKGGREEGRKGGKEEGRKGGRKGLYQERMERSSMSSSRTAMAALEGGDSVDLDRSVHTADIASCRLLEGYHWVSVFYFGNSGNVLLLIACQRVSGGGRGMYVGRRRGCRGGRGEWRVEGGRLDEQRGGGEGYFGLKLERWLDRRRRSAAAHVRRTSSGSLHELSTAFGRCPQNPKVWDQRLNIFVGHVIFCFRLMAAEVPGFGGHFAPACWCILE